MKMCQGQTRVQRMFLPVIQPILRRETLKGQGVCWLWPRAGQSSGAQGHTENLHQSLSKKHFVPIGQWRQNCSANYLGSKEWEFEGSVSGLILCKQESHP